MHLQLFMYRLRLIFRSEKGFFKAVCPSLLRTTFGIPLFYYNTGSPITTFIQVLSKMAAALSCVFKAAINDFLARRCPTEKTLNLIQKLRGFHRQYKKVAGQNNARISSTNLGLQDFMASDQLNENIGEEEKIPYLGEESFNGYGRKGISW